MELGMQKSYRKGVANHLGLESCIRRREASDETVTEVSAGRALSFVKLIRAPTLLTEAEGNMAPGANATGW